MLFYYKKRSVIDIMANYKTYDGYDTETLYTLEDAEKVLERKNQLITNTKRRTAVYFLKQKLCGLLLIIIGMICPIIDGDATFSVIVAFPFGIWLLVTKKRVMNFRM